MKFWKNKPKLTIIDGRNLLWRMTDAFSDLYIDKNGEHVVTGGIYGFLSSLLKIHQKYGGKIVVAWEGRDNFRFRLFPGYKQRGEMTNEMAELLEEVDDQQWRIQALLRLMGVEQYKALGCEADDVMATLAKRWTEDGEHQAIIYTADSDLRQCVTAYTFVVSPQRKKEEAIYGVTEVNDKDGVYPKYIADLKALAGDTSDKIPGVRSIGQVTSAKLVNAYGHVKKIIKAAKRDDKNWPVAERFKKVILDSKTELILYKKLTKVKTKAKSEQIKKKRSKKKLLKHLMYYKFASFVNPNEIYALMNIGGEQ